mmetsp:Transcript_18389/g.39534  ORF Transcript_18389/g.39534 Transcript_18389/m.39534 type:complete len:385 (-) Transcript_18389:1346-2500(-)
MRHLHPVASDVGLPLDHRVAECDAVGRQQVIKSRHVGAACCRRPPAARVVVKELHLHHGRHVVPLAKHHQVEAQLVNVPLQLGDLLLVILLLGVHQQVCAVLRRVKARGGAAQHLHEVAPVPQSVVQPVEVGEEVVAVPVQYVMLDVQIVTRHVAWWVLDAVELVPQHSLVAGRGGHHAHHHRQGDGGLPGCHAVTVWVAVRRRGHDRQADCAASLACVCGTRGADPDVQGQVAGPGPQGLAVLKLQVQVLAALVCGGEGGRGLQAARHRHAVEQRGVEDQGQGARVEGLAAVGPHVGAGAQVQLGGDHRGTWLVGLEHLLAGHQVDLACPLLVHIEVWQALRPLHQRLLHGGGVEQRPAGRLRDGGGKQAHCACHHWRCNAGA